MSTEIIRRTLRPGLTLALIVLASCFFYRALDTGYDQLLVPFSLDAGEFSNFESIKVIRAGENPYSSDIYSAPPFVFTGYTPLYHYVVALFPMPDSNPFFWGRVVAAVAMLLAGLLPFLVAGRSGWKVAVVAVGVFFALAPVAQRAVLIRNDSLGLLLAGLSIYLVHRAAGRVGWLVAAVGLSILSVFVKQVYLAAPMACALWLFFSDRKSFYRYMGAGIGLSAVIVLFIQLVWGNGFWFSTIMGPQHPVFLLHGIAVTGLVLLHEPLSLALVVAAVFFGVRETREKGRRAFIESPYLLYILTSTLILVATVGKIGSGTNYFIEPFLAVLLWITYLISRLPRPYLEHRTVVFLAIFVVAAEALQLFFVPRPMYDSARPARAERAIRHMEEERRDIESLGIEQPSVLGLMRHPSLYRESDRVQLSFPLFYFWMWSEGMLDITDLTDRIEAGEFDIIVAPNEWIEGHLSNAEGEKTAYDAVMERPWQLTEATLKSYRIGTRRAGTLYFVRDTSSVPTAR